MTRVGSLLRGLKKEKRERDPRPTRSETLQIVREYRDFDANAGTEGRRWNYVDYRVTLIQYTVVTIRQPVSARNSNAEPWINHSFVYSSIVVNHEFYCRQSFPSRVFHDGYSGLTKIFSSASIYSTVH